MYGNPSTKFGAAKTRLEVDFPGDGRCPGVVPVLVVRSELLVAAGLHDVGPLRELAGGG